MRQVKVSPSDLSFLYDECPRCYYRKTKRIQPIGFSGAFYLGNAFDQAAKGALTPEVAREIGCPVTVQAIRKLEYVKSVPIAFPHHDIEIVLSGKIDRAYDLDGGGTALVEFKYTSEVKLTRVSNQLHAYQRCMEYPASDTEIEVHSLGVINWSPYPENSFKIGKGNQLAIVGPMAYTDIPIDRQGFLDFLEGLARIISSPTLPDPGRHCEICLVVANALAHDRKLEERNAQS